MKAAVVQTPKQTSWVPTGSHRAITLVLFFASGFTGLVYEILWMKELGILFGNTTRPPRQRWPLRAAGRIPRYLPGAFSVARKQPGSAVSGEVRARYDAPLSGRLFHGRYTADAGPASRARARGAGLSGVDTVRREYARGCGWRARRGVLLAASLWIHPRVSNRGRHNDRRGFGGFWARQAYTTSVIGRSLRARPPRSRTIAVARVIFSSPCFSCFFFWICGFES